MKASIDESEVFIPVIPDRRTQFGKMVSGAAPGFILAISVIGSDPATVGAFILNLITFIFGALVIFFAIREFKSPGKATQPGSDMVSVFTGLLLITQGAQMFDALKGFQPAHMYFVAAALFIFKGVMFPESKIKKGYLISGEFISYSISPFKSTIKLPRQHLNDIYKSEKVINFGYAEGVIKTVKMKGVSNLDEMVVALKQELL